MSTSSAQLLDLAKYVIKHAALDALRERIDKRHLKRFRTATAEAREQINAAMDADSAFLEEMKKIIAESEELTSEEDK